MRFSVSLRPVTSAWCGLRALTIMTSPARALNTRDSVPANASSVTCGYLESCSGPPVGLLGRFQIVDSPPGSASSIEAFDVKRAAIRPTTWSVANCGAAPIWTSVPPLRMRMTPARYSPKPGSRATVTEQPVAAPTRRMNVAEDRAAALSVGRRTRHRRWGARRRQPGAPAHPEDDRALDPSCPIRRGWAILGPCHAVTSLTSPGPDLSRRRPRVAASGGAGHASFPARPTTMAGARPFGLWASEPPSSA